MEHTLKDFIKYSEFTVKEFLEMAIIEDYILENKTSEKMAANKESAPELKEYYISRSRIDIKIAIVKNRPPQFYSEK